MIEKITVQRTQEISFYHTSDGKEFTDEYDAQAHEDDLFWNQRVFQAGYDGEVYYCCRYTTAEDYETFIRCLERKKSSDFHCFAGRVYEVGTLLFARVEEYYADYADDVALYTYDSFVKTKQERIDTLTSELESFKSIFRL